MTLLAPPADVLPRLARRIALALALLALFVAGAGAIAYEAPTVLTDFTIDD